MDLLGNLFMTIFNVLWISSMWNRNQEHFSSSNLTLSSEKWQVQIHRNKYA